MGYAGYAPTKYARAPPNEQEAALWRVQSAASLETIAKLLQNAAVAPKEEKFRRIRLGNARIKAVIADEPGAVEALQAFGWTADPADAESLVVKSGRYFTMAEVRLVQEALQRLQKLQREAKRSSAAAKLAPSSDAARVKAQVEADRAERASKAARTE